jgi:hypothetical protein
MLLGVGVGLTLLTRDPKRYQAYFATVRLPGALNGRWQR